MKKYLMYDARWLCVEDFFVLINTLESCSLIYSWPELFTRFMFIEMCHGGQ